MEGVLIAIVSGFFGLAGIWLNNYLNKQKNAAEQAPQSPGPIQQATKAITPANNQAPPVEASPEESPEEVVLIKMPSWWILVTAIVAVSIGGAFFARWIIEYGLSVFNVSSPDAEFGWPALVLGGIAWGLAYVVVGALEFNDDVTECLSPLFSPYDALFGPDDLVDFVRALLTALPINFLISLGAAIGLGNLAAIQFGADSAGVANLVYGSLIIIGIVGFLFDDHL